MAEVTDIVQAISAQLKKVPSLKYVRRFETFEDEHKLVVDGKFPWMNVSMYTGRITDAGNLRRYDAERHEYTLIITFSIRDVLKKTVLEGTASLRGLWDFCEDIIAGLNTDRTFGGVIDDAPLRADVAVDAVNYESGKFWIGRGAIQCAVYRDVLNR
jgi:hypothetical protein